MARRGYRRAFWARAGLGIYLWAAIGPTLHLALGHHEVCLEHGELVHRHGPSEAPHGVMPRASSEPLVSPGARAPVPDEAHTHCLLAQERPRDALVPDAPPLPLVREPEIPPLPLRESMGIAWPRLSVAPKHSPPAC